MNETQIEWVRNRDGSQGYTWNPITGCLNHDNGLCKGGGFPCYAYRLANGRLKQRYLANSNWCHWNPPENGYYDPFYPRFWEERIACQFSYYGKKKQGIFVCDMSDMFGTGIPDEWTRAILKLIDAYPQHRFYLLTKQPQNLIKWSPFPENCYVGVTATTRDMFSWACCYLADVKAKVKYISFEPLLTPIILDQELDMGSMHGIGINWLIIGACTGTYDDMAKLCMKYAGLHPKRWGKRWTAQPPIEWVREIVEAADRAGIPVFLKDNLRPIASDIALFANPTAVYPYGVLRQEMPKGVK